MNAYFTEKSLPPDLEIFVCKIAAEEIENDEYLIQYLANYI